MFSEFRYLSLVIFLAFNQLKAQHPYFYTINDDNGLPSNEVYQVQQDSFGFMWIACDAGLYRYDGFRFIGYSHHQQNSKSISNLTLDKNQYIWSQNFTGQIFRTKADSNSLEMVYDGAQLNRAAPAYTIDQYGHAWIANDSVIIVLDSLLKPIKTIELAKEGCQITIWFDIKATNDNLIYFINYGGEYIIIDATTQTIKKRNTIKGEGTSRYKLLYLNHKMLAFVESLATRQYKVYDITNGLNKELAEFSPPVPTGYNYVINAQVENLFLCTSAGAIVLNRNFLPNPLYKILFEKHKISYSYCDKEGNYWFTSLQDGIFVIPSLDVQVFNTTNSVLKDNNIFSIDQEDKNSLYVGNYSGELYHLDIVSNELKLLEEKEEGKYRAVRRAYKKKEKLYIARGVFTIYNNNKLTTIPALGNVRDFVVNEDTIYYTRSDISGFVTKNNETWEQHVLHKKGGKKVTWDKKNQAVYYACIDGFYVYKDSVFKEIKYNNLPIYGSALQLENNQLWVGTNDMGVLLIEKDSVIKTINTNNLLSDDNIKSMYKHGDTLLVACRKGLNVIQLKQNRSYVINEYDGLAFKEINDITVADQHAYLATIKGLVKLPLNLQWKNKTAPQIKILGAYKNYLPIDLERAIEFNFDDNNLSIDFIAIALRSKSNFNYKYRLKNFDKDWRYINSSTNKINFSSLPPGEYIFEVLAINEDGICSTTSAKIPIHVYAPIWEKWWFYLILSFVFVSIIALIFRARFNFVKRKAEMESKLVVSQLTALKAQMNPHFMYNALNSIQALIIKNELKKSSFYLNKFSKLMRSVLDASGEEFITVQDEVTILELYLELEKLRFGDDFSYKVIIQNNIDTYQMMMPSLILQPFIENAIKHGLLHKKGVKEITIEFQLKDKLICIITDNGVGRKKVQEIQQRLAENHKSFATQATKKRIELLNNFTKDEYGFDVIDLYDNDGISKGTKVVICIPIKPLGN